MINRAEVLHAKRRIRHLIRLEEDAINWDYGIKDDVWIWYGGMVKDYDASFAGVLAALNLGSFRKLLMNRLKNGLTANVLDLMGGDASFIRDLKYPPQGKDMAVPLSGGICESLTDSRRERLKQVDQKFNIGFICGDLTSKSTFNSIDQKREEMGINAFDLIVCRGAGGIHEDFIPSSLYPFLFGKILGMLTDNNGIFITQLPETVTYQEILDQLRKVDGLRVNFQPKGTKEIESYPSMGMIKSRGNL